MNRKYLGFLIDSVILIFSFYFFIWLKFHTVFPGWLTYKTSFYFYGICFFLSLFTGKNKVVEKTTIREVISVIALSSLVILAFFAIIGRYLYHFIEFRFVLIFATFLATGLEILIGVVFISYQKLKERSYYREQDETEKTLEKSVSLEELAREKEFQTAQPEEIRRLHSIISAETNQATYDFISRFFFYSLSETLITSTTTVFNLLNQSRDSYRIVINLKRINDMQYINKFFEGVNSKLANEGLFIDWVETYGLRRKRILSKYSGGINQLVYAIDFMFHRVFPKLPVVKKLYFFITKGSNRVLSKAETYGRLYSCGFEFMEEQLIGDHLFFVFRKVKEPIFDLHPSYGPIIKLKRIGKNGKIIGVYKLRTMHAYSEYLQGYVYEQNSLQEGGKFKDDFRITALGRIFRKLWIDELPMLINLARGDLKIVGVRPLSRHYFELYTKELQEKRVKQKPGLIPPFYADMPKTLDEIMASELKYLEAHERSPFLTDIRYFFKAFYNILFKRARSN